MSKLGETADMILEMIKSGKNRKSDIERKLQLKDTAILDFLEEYGLIRIDTDHIDITQSGLELLTQE